MKIISDKNAVERQELLKQLEMNVGTSVSINDVYKDLNPSFVTSIQDIVEHKLVTYSQEDIDTEAFLHAYVNDFENEYALVIGLAINGQDYIKVIYKTEKQEKELVFTSVDIVVKDIAI
ncbi:MULTISPECIES: hypothetical protein [Bacillus]|uniref:Uncharacterized protein n=2 Tax=Bacillus thuringiensis TaxID=1428 RepID=A0AAP4V2V8_BACTU|nr:MULTISPECIES: hypothetical protein [Bacillus]MEC0046498.1 hypothetical protein [Bacillus cereus]AFV21865.1 hypothetical protein BTB_502p05600 [Bacillus thuringiensis Bt407]EEM25111.1 hypothetical protein bthur0002_57530 [Bacillus thuringiensis Bt407]ERI00958.1 hypothetical protein BTCBT_002513 [Bacillus thuringiensis T01-328]MBN6707723.1 hypothetical protein [Bacillus thuringiensis]